MAKPDRGGSGAWHALPTLAAIAVVVDLPDEVDIATAGGPGHAVGRAAPWYSAGLAAPPARLKGQTVTRNSHPARAVLGE
jgi:hypothetical protein